MSISRENILKLQNGSDVRGVAVGGVEGQPVTLTGEAANRIAAAFARWLSEKSGKPIHELKIGVGHDSRISAPALGHEVLAGLLAQGVGAYDCGLASTPSMFMSIVFPETAFDGSIMITASHLPYNRNGLKFFTPDGGLEKADITALLETAALLSAQDADLSAAGKADLIPLYAKSLCEKIRLGVNAQDYDHPLAGLKIVVDAGNGAGGFFVEQVLAPLGADTTGSQFLEPDGMFPNHIPNPENKAAMDAIRHATVSNHADLGIIFDTDVDRMSAVLHDGTEVCRDAIIAMMAAILAKDYPGSTIVTDSVTSDKLTDFLENTLHLRHHRFKRGYKNVINESKRLNDAGTVSPLAIETSGHGALSENYFLDDGAYLAVKLLIAAANARKQGKQVDSLIEKLPRQFECREYRMNLLGENFKAYGQEVLKVFEGRAKAAGYTVAPNSYEGVRLSFTGTETQGWMLLRLSLHDPLMPLNLEGNRPGDCDRIVTIAKELLTGFDRLDLSPLAK
ncbi:phosphomannomutase/phosphoglucomutase [Anaerotruncus rubiinfantis]|uniref:phosphomannomutase/phosphoglucomutase n=1 Tax=Anaerotruncus rubiinfantis TaxID=1720200 RepID=UPI0034A586AC